MTRNYYEVKKQIKKSQNWDEKNGMGPHNYGIMRIEIPVED